MEEIKVEELKKWIDSKVNFLLLDVREKPEVEYCKINGSIHIPLAEIPDSLAKLPNDKPIVVHCHSGGRSDYVSGFLKSKGYNAINLIGGIDAWSEKIDKKVKKY